MFSRDCLLFPVLLRATVEYSRKSTLILNNNNADHHNNYPVWNEESPCSMSTRATAFPGHYPTVHPMFNEAWTNGFHAIIRNRCASVLKRMLISSNRILNIIVGRCSTYQSYVGAVGGLFLELSLILTILPKNLLSFKWPLCTVSAINN